MIMVGCGINGPTLSTPLRLQDYATSNSSLPICTMALEEVMDFYNRGGGVGMGLDIDNQTLSPDPLDLTPRETKDIIAFLTTLTDTIGLNPGTIELPMFESNPEWNNRRISY